MALSRKHRRTLEAVFDRPTRADIRWLDVESLLLAVGAQLSEGAGSRVRMRLGGQVMTFHRPHPGSQARRYAVEAVRGFLADHGHAPEGR